MTTGQEKFSQMADAMEQVATLPYDPAFLEFIHTHRVATTVHYEQDTAKPDFCLDSSLLRSLSPQDFLGHHIVTLRGLTLDTLTTENGTTLSGSAEINQTDYHIKHSDDSLTIQMYDTAQPDAPASIILTEQQFSEFVLAGLVLQGDNSINMDDVIALYGQMRDESTLPALLLTLGSANGTALRTTTTQFGTDNDDILAVKLVERESPTDNIEKDTLSLYTTTELFTDTSHLVKEQSLAQQHDSISNHPKQSRVEYALRAVDHTDANRASLETLVNGVHRSSSRFTRYESSGDDADAREYAAACIQFLSAYRRAKKQAESESA